MWGILFGFLCPQVLDALRLADTHQLHSLKQQCFAFVRSVGLACLAQQPFAPEWRSGRLAAHPPSP